MSHLVLDGLTKRYGDHLAVDGLNLAVEKGEFVSLLGPSGCGKTTTLQMIAGFVEPSAAASCSTARISSRVAPNKRGLGIVFQSYALFPHMTVAENVAFGLEMRGVAHAERDRRVAEALALVGLQGFADRYPAPHVGRPAAARRAGARALVIQPPAAAARRAALQSRRQAARGDAGRAARRSSARSAPPRSSSPMTSTRRWRCPTASS